VNLPTLFPGFFGQDQAYHLAEYDAARYILLESPFTLETFLLQGIPRDRLAYLPRGVDTGRFVPAREKRDGTFRALFVGALCVRKGVPRLLDAWSSLKLKNAELLLVGTLRDEVRTLVTSYTAQDPSIRIAGFVRNPVSLYQEASVFVFPSLSEGSAKVTYEAMACGLPVIVTPNAGSVARDGRDGYVVPLNDREALMGKILDLYEHHDERRDMGHSARKLMESFTWERHRRDLIALYERAFRGEHPQPEGHAG
jgi:glycosyltransferase involved in cell wall biosynthesis